MERYPPPPPPPPPCVLSSFRLVSCYRLRGRVANLRAGELLAEVTIDLREGQQVVAAVTRASVDRLGLRVDGPVSIYVKATELTLGP